MLKKLRHTTIPIPQGTQKLQKIRILNKLCQYNKEVLSKFIYTKIVTLTISLKTKHPICSVEAQVQCLTILTSYTGYYTGYTHLLNLIPFTPVFPQCLFFLMFRNQRTFVHTKSIPCLIENIT